MILEFGDQASADIYHGADTKAARSIPKDVWKAARRKLDMLNAAHAILDLSVPPGNRLERLKGKLSDFYSVRVNDQFRIIFKWKEGNVRHVQITDYH